MLSSGGITKRLDRLQEAGLVERRPNPDDRRGALVRLTRKGRAVIDGAFETHIANEERLLQPLSPADRGALDKLLRRLLADLDSSTAYCHDRLDLAAVVGQLVDPVSGRRPKLAVPDHTRGVRKADLPAELPIPYREWITLA